MRTKHTLHFLYKFLFMFLILSLKYVVPSLYIYFKYSTIYLFDGALYDVFVMTILSFIVYVFYYFKRQNVLAFISVLFILLYFLFK